MRSASMWRTSGKKQVGKEFCLIGNQQQAIGNEGFLKLASVGR